MRERPLAGRVAVVTGASRGVGKGIAIALGEAGAKVYVTARTSASRQPGNYQNIMELAGLADMPGSIEETAREIQQRGGEARPVVCDHRWIKDVQSLAARISGEDRQVDILVNNAWGGHEGFNADFSRRFWDIGIEPWEHMMVNGVRNAILTTQKLMPLLLRSDRALIVGTTFRDGGRYLQGNFFYDLAKAAISRACMGFAEELRGTRIASVGLSPGFVRTELVDAMLRKAHGPPGHVPTETPAFSGRAVVAMAADTAAGCWSGRTVTTSELARHYGFTDVDGSVPEAFHLARAMPE